ncbi:outer membrane protein transport protein [Arvimicrobium flavum]|uniref:outer membrane protein transport protein n=1 Tax=Arvimicrobium flavum TaxID=3393320 RepID=UPI00237ADAD0|nr:outer membrane protein transport protein [Mesorhizobium shangrilense]
MYGNALKSALGAGIAALVLGGAAHANGFARGTADTDILYEEGGFTFRSGMTFVNPSREYTKHGNPANVGTDAFQDYVIPSIAFKLDVSDAFRCAGTYTTPYGGAVKYAAPTLSGKTEEDFVIHEIAATCAVKFSAGKGNVYLLGGVYQEEFDYNRFNVSPLGGLQLDLRGTEMGYRLGVGYDIPDIALRAQLLYRSGTDYGASGTLTGPAGVLAPQLGLPATMQIPVRAIGIGHLPQTVEAKFQSGIAPGWLAFANIKWSNWSVQDSLDVRSAVTGQLISRDIYNWDDGWTITAGIGHAFNDVVSGAVSLTWDQGVGTGWDLQSDVWTLASGVSVKDTLGGELRAGVGVSYLTSAEETQYAPAVNSAVDDGWSYAGSISYRVKW